MYNELMKELKEVEKDCLRLKKQKQLTEYGKGQLDMVKTIKKIIGLQSLKKK